MKKILIPPLAPTALLLFVCLWSYINEQTAFPTLVEGKVDNAPMRAIVILALCSPLFYVICALLNWVTILVGRAIPTSPWIPPVIVCMGLAVVTFTMLYKPALDASDKIPQIALVSLIGAVATIYPMTIWERRL